MSSLFPTSIDSFTTKVNNVDTISAAHINDVQDSIVEIETLLGAGSTRRLTTWSPVLTFSSGNPTSITYGASNKGFYAVFGSLVYVSARFEVSARSGGSGNFQLSTPGNTSATANSHSVFNCFANSGFGATAWPSIGITNPGLAYMNLYSYSSTSAGTIISTTTAGTTSALNLWFTGFYWI
jgi:hypothetical protein